MITLQFYQLKCPDPIFRQGRRVRVKNLVSGDETISMHAHQEMQVKTLFVSLVILQDSWTICGLQYVKFPFIIATSIVVILLSSRWQRHPRDRQLWTNAKPMHGVQQMNLLQYGRLGSLLLTPRLNTVQSKKHCVFLVMWTVRLINYCWPMYTIPKPIEQLQLLQYSKFHAYGKGILVTANYATSFYGVHKIK